MNPIYIDALWLSIAFLSGLAMRKVSLPPLIGFLATGFFLNYFGFTDGNLQEVIATLSDLGITLLLFTIGLKIKLSELFKKEVLVTTSVHMLLSTMGIGGVLFLLSYFSLPLFEGISLESAIVIGIALSFSSTVFIIKSLEQRGEITSRHGRFAIGVLIIQDLFAVLLLTFSKTEWPSIWVLTLPVYLYVVHFVLSRLLSHTGHGELLTVFGFFAPFIAGALAFDLVDLKYDLGALIVGMLLVKHDRSEELYDRMMSYKDFFLVGFFINIGLQGVPTWNNLVLAVILLVFVFFKGLLFFKLFSFFDLRARSNFLTSMHLSNYSEFGLIVGAVAVSSGLLTSDWLVTIALTMSFSFLLSSPVVERSYEIFERFKDRLQSWNRTSLEIDSQPFISGKVKYVVAGLGSIGMPAFLRLSEDLPRYVIGVDYNQDKINQMKEDGFDVVWGDTTDRDFWEESNWTGVEFVILTMSDFASNSNSLKQINKLNNRSFKIAVISHYEDEKAKLEELGADFIYNYKTEVGEDFAEHAIENSDTFLDELSARS
jgi:predicted Kef-type K+ transport protein